jgi:hypothetical protein
MFACVGERELEPVIADPALEHGDQPSETKLVRQPGAIAGEYIVVLHAAPRARMAPALQQQLDATIDGLGSAYQATVGHRYGAALSGFAAKLTEQDALALAADTAVAFNEAGVSDGDPADRGDLGARSRRSGRAAARHVVPPARPR